MEKNYILEVESKIYDFKTKYKEGFIINEIEVLLKDYPEFDYQKFSKKLGYVTCITINDELIIYKHDVFKTMICLIENRGINLCEFD